MYSYQLTRHYMLFIYNGKFHIKKACPKKGRPLLTYEKHLFTKIGEILNFATFTYIIKNRRFDLPFYLNLYV